MADGKERFFRSVELADKALHFSIGPDLVGRLSAWNQEGVEVLGGAIRDEFVRARRQRRVIEPPLGTNPLPLRIVPFDEWQESLRGKSIAVTGPALETVGARLASYLLLPREMWSPQPMSLLRLGLARLQAGQRDDPFLVEPLYLRASSAEEKWAALGKGP